MAKEKITVGTIWITGLAVSGKTTLGQGLFKDLLNKGIDNVEFFDGEDVRTKLNKMHGDFLTKDRDALNMYKADLALKENRAGKVVIVTSISHTRTIRRRVRQHIGKFMEVYLKCPVSVCAQRDYKGHYKKAFAGEYDNFIGVTEPYEESDKVELTLNTGYQTMQECSQILLEASLDFIYDRIREKALE